jgi:hypothetical protein
MRSDVIDAAEKMFILAWGKAQRSSGKEVTSRNLQMAYWSNFPGDNRRDSELKQCWERWYTNQKKDKSVWFRSLPQKK